MRVARGESTSVAAKRASSSLTVGLPISAALAHATARAMIDARIESTPSTSAVPHKTLSTSSCTSMRASPARAAAMSSILPAIICCMSMSFTLRGDIGRRSSSKASRSRKAGESDSSSDNPSSSATTAKRVGRRSARPSRSSTTARSSMTCVNLAAVAAGKRSAMLSISVPPSASASNPCCNTGRPVASVADKSKPPSKRSSVIEIGIRTQRDGLMSERSKFSQALRTGPAEARIRTPPNAPGSIASKTATCTACCQRLS